MNTFKPNDKVVCIDATPIPIGAPNNNYQDFEFPNGYIEEGTIYNVEDVVAVRQSGESLYITGPSVLLNNQHIPWNGQRFRKVERNKEKAEQKAALSPQLCEYCVLDTLAVVELWEFFSGKAQGIN